MRRRLRDWSDTDLVLLAQCELSSNPSITVYTFENGVERRRLANPYAALAQSLDRCTEAATKAGDRIREAFEAISKALASWHNAKRPPPIS